MFKYLLLSIFTTILINCTLNAKAQRYFKTSNHRNIHISPTERKIDATIIIASKYPKSSSKVYYWFDNSEIHHTQGGSGGYLLDGDYSEYFYPGNNLSIKGNFKKGLKNGIWEAWYDNGDLKERAYWKKGYLSGKKYYYSSTGVIYKMEEYKKNCLNGFTFEWTSDTSIRKYFYRNGKVATPGFWDKISLSHRKDYKERKALIKDKNAVTQDKVKEQDISRQHNSTSKKKKGFHKFWSNTKNK